MVAGTRKLYAFHGGVHPPANKAQSTRDPVMVAPVPARLVVPLQQHIGVLPEPVVKVGERVLKGQLIGQTEGYVGAPVHAPTSGTVVEVAEHPVPHPSGLSAPCVVIETDGAEEWVELDPVGDFRQARPDELRRRVRDAGIIGMGGAGFPTAVKLNPPPHPRIETLLLNGAECEPYITADDMLMRERGAEVVQGALIMQHILGAREVVVAIEDNKHEAYDAMLEAAADTEVEVVRVPTLYPTGGEKQLIKIVTGREVPSKGIPAQIGIVCQNVGTAAATFRAIGFGEPLLSRIVTVTGGAVRSPRNLEALIGTPVEELLRLCDPHFTPEDRLIMGGPMMGFALRHGGVPVVKATNCILAATPRDMLNPGEVMACIRCGECARVCPARLLPQQLYWHSRAKEFDKVQDYSLFDCIECGCCSYVCPSHIPLVQYYRFAKTEIWAQEKEKQKADLARRRHEFREMRLDREKREKAERHKKAAEARKAAAARKDSPAGDKPPDAKQAAIEAALERVKARKMAAGQTTREAGGTTAEKDEIPPGASGAGS